MKNGSFLEEKEIREKKSKNWHTHILTGWVFSAQSI